VKSLPLNLTVANLKALFQRLFKVSPHSVRLVAVFDKHTPPLPLDDDLSSLHDYGLRSASEIIAHDNAVPERRR
jgi:hypothetical protein